MFQPGIFPAGDAGAGNFFEPFAPVRRELCPRGAEVLSDLLYGVDPACADVDKFTLQHKGYHVAGKAGVGAFEIEILQKSAPCEIEQISK